jgi:hypothetical protein
MNGPLESAPDDVGVLRMVLVLSDRQMCPAAGRPERSPRQRCNRARSALAAQRRVCSPAVTEGRQDVEADQIVVPLTSGVLQFGDVEPLLMAWRTVMADLGCRSSST